MNLRKPLVLAAVTGALVAGSALPASAAPDTFNEGESGTTATTFELTGGALTMTIQDSAILDPADVTVGENVITGSLGATSVSDLRGGDVAWNVSASSTVFTGVLGSSSVGVSYTGGAVTASAGVTVAAGTETVMPLTPATAAPVISPTAVSGSNTASWDPELAVTMEAGALADEYSGVVTTSLA